MVIIFLTAVILYSHYNKDLRTNFWDMDYNTNRGGIPHFRRVTIKKEGLSLPFENGNPFKRES